MEELKQVNLFPCGNINAPSSKSVAHRTLICAALAQKKVVIKNLLMSQDIKATLRCIAALGGKFTYNDNILVIDKGIKYLDGTLTLDCGESGSTLRFFMPIAAALGVTAKFTGAQRLFERPIAPYENTLCKNGISLKKCSDGILQSGKLKNGSFYLPGNVSSQFVTGLLLALPLLNGDSQINITSALQSTGYVDLTIGELSAFGIRVQNNKYETFLIKGSQTYKAVDRTIEGDYSGAAFLLVAAALGCKVSVSGLLQTSLQGDKAILSILQKAGAKYNIDAAGTITIKADKLSAFDLDVSEIPDLVPPVAALMCFCEGESHIVNAARLRIKESDRLATVTQELSRMGAKITQAEDSLTITGMPHIKGGCTVQAHNDHRIAMMCAVAAIKAQRPITVCGSQCVAKSYPDFWQQFCKAPLN